MCGILCAISASGPCSIPSPELLELLKARGPDSLDHATGELRQPVLNDGDSENAARDISGGIACLSVVCYASVLSLRGPDVTPQPLSTPATGYNWNEDQKPVLTWNGEIWAYKGQGLSYDECDTTFLYSALCEAVRSDHENSADGKVIKSRVIEVLNSIEGPFAIVLLDQLNGKLYYGRDRTGRRSLLVKQSSSTELQIASVGDGTPGWAEVEAGSLYCLQIHRLDSAATMPVMRVPHTPNMLIRQEYTYEATAFNDTIPQDPIALSEGSTSVLKLKELLHAALAPRLHSVPAAWSHDTSRFAILFSGGVDCTTLARMMHDMLPLAESIDLLNVAFENPRTTANLDASEIYSSCPDRATGLSSFDELSSTCPERTWRLVIIDVPYVETLHHRPMITKLMHPHATEMDLSITTALYFAARGQGTARLSSAPGREPYSYSTPARILVSGLGADELFGGYQRHATAFKRAYAPSKSQAKAYEALLAELELDYRRLGARNLGRDDRVLSHWGRECRFPFLDERLVRWAVGLRVDEKCGSFLADTTPAAPSSKEIAGSTPQDPAKLVLRLVAQSLGLLQASRLAKRAMQFGARTAKMEAGRGVRGTDPI